MRIKTTAISYYLIIFNLLLAVDFWNLFNISIYNDFNSTTNKTFIALLSCLWVIFIGQKKSVFKITVPYLNFTKKYFLWVAFVFSIQSVYGIFSYHQTVLDMYIALSHYLLILQVPIYIHVFKKYSFHHVLKLIVIFVSIDCIFVLLYSLSFNLIGFKIPFLHYPIENSFGLFRIRSDRLRLSFGEAFLCIMPLFSFFMFISKNGISKIKIKYLLLLILSIITIIYSAQTRMLLIALILSLLVMWFSSKPNIKAKIKILFFTSVLVLLNINTIKSFKDSFSTNNEETGGSSLARAYAFSYYSQFTDNNIFLGMGPVRNYRPDLAILINGKEGLAHFDDIGIFGLFFRYGILGLSCYLIFIFYLFFTLMKVKKYNPHYYSLLCGLFSWVILTSPSLIITDAQRMPLFPLILALFEYTRKETFPRA